MFIVVHVYVALHCFITIVLLSPFPNKNFIADIVSQLLKFTSQCLNTTTLFKQIIKFKETCAVTMQLTDNHILGEDKMTVSFVEGMCTMK
ncbi:unnamed protein product [Litomosoides sigmodontis]|uniref:Uncharacterized protein n=1 Tax=Litomosoides sigmodontis TaxID=42156 RepID=A0A3P6S660_LITSI|nr:unnamed protein product [Litomosoides sigmodontis]